MSATVTQAGEVLTVTLGRPERGNALDVAMVEALRQAAAGAPAAGARLLVLRGEGKHFCTGFDLGDLEAQSEGDLLLRFVRIEQLLQAIRHAPVPTLALAQGRVIGAGADLFAACSLRVAAPGASFAFPGSRFGLVLGTRRLAAVAGPQAVMELQLRGRSMAAEAALACGLATQVAPEAEWPALVEALACEVAEAPEATALALKAAALPDTRAEDMADLVASAARPGLKQRIAAFAARRAKPS